MMNDLGTRELTTDRLILRRFTLDDVEVMYNSWATDEEVNQYVDWPIHKSIDETRELVSARIKEYDDDSYNWIVEIKDTHEVIGSISLVKCSKKNRNCEIGYCYSSKHWNRGYATEALKRVIDYLISDCKFHVVQAVHYSSNPASGKVMTKAGMQYEATLKERHINKVDGSWEDEVYYSVINRE